MSGPSDATVGWGATRIRRFTGSSGSLREYLGEELAAHPQRLVRTIRLALMASVGTGLMAAMHVESAFGPYLLWAVAAAPRAMMTPAQAARLVLTEGVLLVAAVPLAGVLVEAPWFYIPFLTALVAARAYLVKRYNLSNAWLLVGVTVLSSFYSVVFDPRNFGWEAASTFAGAVIAFAVITAVDSYLWPDPAETILLETVARDLERTRDGLRLMRRVYFDPADRAALARAAGNSPLPVLLDLLDRADREGATARRKSQLLAFVTLTERVRMELAGLLLLAGEAVPDGLRPLFRAEVDGAVAAIGPALGWLAEQIRSGGTSADDLPASIRDPIAPALARLDARSTALALHTRPGVDPAELANLSSFFLGLHALGRLLEKGAEYPQLAVAAAGAPPVRITDPETIRHALKLAAAMATMLVIALTTQRPEMTAALWTVFIAGLPSHGATLRKLALRLAGVLAGGAVAIAAIAIVTPNFDTVLSYMIACFVVLAGCAWAAQSSNRIAYAGSQAGTTFILVFAGLSPSARIYEPLWRIWAVILGVGVTGSVFLALWPNYAAASMLPRLKKLLELDLRMIGGGRPALTDAAIAALQTESTDTLTQLLGVADDARLEGPRSGVSADAIVHATGTLRRIAHRLGWVAAGRSAQPALSAASELARRTFEDALARRFSAWRDYFATRPLDRSRADAIRTAHRADDLERALNELVSRTSSDSYAEIGAWPLHARRALLAETESYHRLVVLSAELDQHFAAAMTA